MPSQATITPTPSPPPPARLSPELEAKFAAARELTLGTTVPAMLRCPHVPRLDTDHRQAGFGECTEQPLR